jgi:hypothetical protein
MDHTCRWLFVLAYIASVLATALTLVHAPSGKN